MSTYLIPIYYIPVPSNYQPRAADKRRDRHQDIAIPDRSVRDQCMLPPHIPTQPRHGRASSRPTNVTRQPSSTAFCVNLPRSTQDSDGMANYRSSWDKHSPQGSGGRHSPWNESLQVSRVMRNRPTVVEASLRELRYQLEVTEKFFTSVMATWKQQSASMASFATNETLHKVYTDLLNGKKFKKDKEATARVAQTITHIRDQVFFATGVNFFEADPRDRFAKKRRERDVSKIMADCEAIVDLIPESFEDPKACKVLKMELIDAIASIDKIMRGDQYEAPQAKMSATKDKSSKAPDSGEDADGDEGNTFGEQKEGEDANGDEGNAFGEQSAGEWGT